MTCELMDMVYEKGQSEYHVVELTIYGNDPRFRLRIAQKDSGYV